MDHFPRFFTHSQGSSPIDPKRSRRKPKLERRNAAKHIEYDADSFSSSLDDSSDITSFRVEGTDGDFDRLCRILGVSGPEDFGIPADAWEAHRIRSSTNLQSGSRFHRLDSPDEKRKGKGESEIVVADLFDRVVDNDAELNRDGRIELKLSSSVVSDGAAAGGGGASRIKGLRPPVLKPPPAMTLPLSNNASSTWDLFRELAPTAGLGMAHLSFSDEEDEGGGKAEGEVGEEIGKRSVKEEETQGRIGETSMLSASSSFSSSTTTEPTPYISPHGRFKRIISDDWQKGELLGRGSFGSVYEGIDYDGFFFAIKEVSLLDQGSQGKQSLLQLEQEIDLLSKFEHENIVQYYGTSKDESHLYIFLELVTKGSLLSLYQKYNLRDSQVSAYTRQILLGLKYLHDRNVVHRDIKCANILVDASGSVKLADFGLAKATKVNDVKSCKGTAFWMAPEVVNLRNQGYGLPADIWSLGCTVLEMLTGQIPYSHLECMQALFRIGKGQPPPVPDSLSKDARDFILQCLEVNPNNRPTAAQLLHHPFLKRPLPTSSGSVSPHFGR